MEIHTSEACWSVGHTTLQGHSRGRGPSYQPCTCTHIYVGVCASVAVGGRSYREVVPAGQLKNSVESSIATARDSVRTHDRPSNSNSLQISLSFVMTDKTREEED